MHLLYCLSVYGSTYMASDAHKELLLELQRRGHLITVFTLASRGEPISAREPQLEDDILVQRVVLDEVFSSALLSRIGRPLFIYERFLPVLSKYAMFLRRHPEIDVIHVEGAYPFGAIAALVSLWVHKPLEISIGGGDVIASRETNYGYGRYVVPRNLLRFTFQRAALVRANSPSSGEMAVALGCPPRKISAVAPNIEQACFLPLGVNWEAARYAARARLAEQYGLNDGPIVVAAGRLLAIKGFDNLVRAMPMVLHHMPETHFVLCGPNRYDSKWGDYQKYLENLAASLGVRERLLFTGEMPRPQMREWLSAADVVAAPSIVEGANRVVLEAAAVGTPFVVTATTGMADLMRDYDCGIIIPPHASATLAAEILTLLRDPSARRRMGANGLRFAQNFTAEAIVEQLLQDYASAGLVKSMD
jgi:glycosyltransferase involved in cell wall biosynthesis